MSTPSQRETTRHCGAPTFYGRCSRSVGHEGPHDPWGCEWPAASTPSAATSERDWTEDASHENGDYTNRCIHCGETFVGHKRRVACRLCAHPAAEWATAFAAPLAPSEAGGREEERVAPDDLRRQLQAVQQEVERIKALKPDYTAPEEYHRAVREKAADILAAIARASEGSPS